MEKELGIIDSILGNLVSIKSFYEHEHEHLTKFIKLSKKFKKDTLNIKELEETNEIFEKEANKELKFFENKLLDIEQKLEILDKDIVLRKQSREKLVTLFRSLKTINSFDDPVAFKKTVEKGVVDHSHDNLPIMDIREELDDDGSIMSSQIKPYEHPSKFNEILEKKPQKKRESKNINVIKSQKNVNINEEVDESGNIIKSSFRLLDKEVDNKIERKEELKEELQEVQKKEFRPFMIREEIDEDGNIIESSVERIPSLQKGDGENNQEKDSEVDEDQLSALFEDMGLRSKTISKAVDPEFQDIQKVKQKDIVSTKLSENVEDTIDTPKVQSFQYQSHIDPTDLLTLELLADQIDEEEDEDEFDEEWELEGTEHDNDEVNDSEEDQDDIIQQRAMNNMFGGRAGDLFRQKVFELRKSKFNDDQKAIVVTAPQSMDGNMQILDSKFKKVGSKKPKKSVSFNNTVNVKQVDNIWDDIRKSEVENEVEFLKPKNTKVMSKFKMARMENEDVTEQNQEGEQFEENDNVTFDVVERTINTVSSIDSKEKRLGHDVFKTFDPIDLKKQLEANMPSKEDAQSFVKLSKDRTPSRFKMARAAEMGKQFQSTHITKDVYEKLQEVAQKMIAVGEKKEKLKEQSKKNTILNKQMRSLKPLNPMTKRSFSSVVINTPKDDNPLVINPSYNDEDYEIIRSEINEDLFDDDDEGLLDEYIAEKILDNVSIASTVDKVRQSPEQIGEEDNHFFSKLEKKHNIEEGKVEVMSTELDYNNLQHDMDTMAKAYVLGLYDDDIETQGQVIEELNDFAEHNNTIKAKDKSKLHNRVTEINNLAEGIKSKASDMLDDDEDKDDRDGGPMVATRIVEHDIIEVNEINAIPDDDLDIELNDENLNSKVSLDYTKLRTRMLHKYKGGFKKTEKEKEFELIDDTQRISRFKAARLGL